jgi:zinc protease
MRLLDRIIKTLSLLAVAFCGVITDSECGKLGIKTTTLSNGMKVIVVKTKAKNVVSMCVGYFVGSADDPRSTVGISHLLEHMMFKGTTTIDGDHLKKLLFTYNKSSGAFTSFDITVFWSTCAPHTLDMNLKIEADRMVNLKLSKDAIDSEKKVVIEERKLVMETNPIANHMQEAAWKATFLYSTYSYPIIGYMDQIEACDEDAIHAHYEKYYVPSNAFLLIVGDAEFDEVVRKAEKFFGSIPPGKKPDRARVIEPSDTGLKYDITHESPQIAIHNFNMMFRVQRPLISDLRKLLTTSMAIDIMGGDESSILYQRIVDTDELAFTLATYFDVRAFDAARVNIASVAREAKSVPLIRGKILEIVAALLKTPPSKKAIEEAVENAKRKYIDQINMALDDTYSIAMIVLEYLINGYGIEDIDSLMDIITDIRPAEVYEAGRSVFDRNNMFMTILSCPKV